MYRLSSIIIALLVSVQLLAQSPHGTELKIDCAQCHNPNGWSIDLETIKFDHNASTQFKLEDTHAQIDCKECHSKLVFNKAKPSCISCHTDVHSASVGNDCTRCHTTNNWVINNVPELHEENGFPLVGPHNSLNCVECHTSETNLRFDKIGNECISCHQTTFDATVNPNHKSAGFSTDCLECHSPLATSWTPATFNHDMFPLTLGHDIQECKLCHKDNNYTNTSPDCVSCHQNNFDTSVNPNHKAADFSTDCATCHTTNPGWTPTTWNHNDFYPLNGAHSLIASDCVACHKPEYGTYANTPNTCVGCHLENFNATKEPNHSALGFSTDCTSCHTEDSWIPSTFNHDQFPLTEGHDIADCTQCHKTGNYADASPECVSCHQTNYDATSNPNHKSAGISTDCIACHTPGGWTPSTLNHDFFPLTQGHDIADCKQCHTTGNFADASPECVSCHQTNYDATTNPNHKSAGFSTDCVSCHTPGGWTPSTFNHDFFPLTQGHDIADCKKCHTTGSYTDASPECVSCHQTNYDTTTNPNHKSAGFSTDCTSCHTTGGWTPSTFNHDFFPLTQGHNIADCKKCHTTGNYSDASSECVSCHQSDYNTTTNPNHKSAQFPTDCTACHTTSPGWTPATFDHDGMYFPIYSGKHRGEWSSCTECHTVANNYASFSCITCHEHSNRSSVDKDHNGVGGYSYVSSECFRCHPSGNSD